MGEGLNAMRLDSVLLVNNNTQFKIGILLIKFLALKTTYRVL